MVYRSPNCRSSLLVAVLGALLTAGLASGTPVHLRCEYMPNPLGMDEPAPRFSWQSDNTERNWQQSAYQILVSSTAGGKPNVWDSGKVESSESNGIVYKGPKLESRHRYYWTVRVWDGDGKPYDATEQAWWEMGLLEKADWSAKWIGAKNPEDEADRAAGIRWVWVPGEDAFKVAQKTERTLSIKLDFPQKPRAAIFDLITRGDSRVRVNGKEVAARHRWHEFDSIDIGNELTAGKNAIEVTVVADTAPAGIAGMLKITRADGTLERIPSGERWGLSAGIADLGDKRFGDGWPSQPAQLLRHPFRIAKTVRSARIYVTALGSYRMFINGSRVGKDILSPDWTDYRKRVLYQTYDVTSLLTRGENAIGAILGDGWYGSGLGWSGQRFNFGPRPPRLIAQLEILYTDGQRQTVMTDPSWKTSRSPILSSEIYAGEKYDARLEQPGWDKARFRDAQWLPALAFDAPAAIISSQISPTIQVTATLAPKSVTPLPGNVYIFDMGQNMVGWTSMKVSGPAGTVVRLRFAEILKPDGNIYRDNLRGADATDTYILRGSGQETFTPHFTYHGFRYVEITGYPGKPAADALSGQVFHTANEFSGTFATSNPLVNQIWTNALWGQRGNLESVPTDCPQRDERLGWMGDAQIFWRTASYNMDMAAFTRKWMRDVVEAQSPAGGFSDVSPRVIDESDGAPAWGDAGVIIPWTSWQQYGDTRVVEESWAPMERWMNYIGSVNPDLLRIKRRNNDFGDWVPADSTTPKDLIATAYWAYDANLMSQMAQALGKEQDAKRYADLFNGIKAAFQKAYIHEDGKVGNGSQTCYALALYMKLVPDSQIAAVTNLLVRDIEAHQWHLTTGFVGTPYLLMVLSMNGHSDAAAALLISDTYPSWGYMVRQGATTMWERWNGDHGDPSMNSYNHYAFGSVVEWMYRMAAGIDTDPLAPGFRKMVIRPHIDARLPHVRAEYDSVYGKIVSEYATGNYGVYSFRLTVPANTSAQVYLPAISLAHVTEGGKPVQGRNLSQDTVMITAGSGSYEFLVK